jgi:MerR family transcriptional regulator/heat shock protein HspR
MSTPGAKDASPGAASVTGTASLSASTSDGVRRSRRGAPRAVYVISVAAELAGVHPQTLRIYERKGLLDPERTVGGSRRYSADDIDRLHRIQDLTAAGLNLEGVRRVLELEAEVARLRRELTETRRELRESVEQVHRHYRRDLVPFDASPMRWLPKR